MRRLFAFPSRTLLSGPEVASYKLEESSCMSKILVTGAAGFSGAS